MLTTLTKLPWLPYLNKLLRDVKIGPFLKLIDLIQPLCSKLFQSPLISAVNYTTSFTQRRKYKHTRAYQTQDSHIFEKVTMEE